MINVSSTEKVSINEILQGDVRATYGELGRIRLTEHGITYGREPMVTER
jgi:predicted RNA-binding protein